MQKQNKKISEKQYFIEACFSDNLQSFYKQYVDEKPDRIQYFNVIGEELTHKYWSPSIYCVETKEELTVDNIDVLISYWTPFVWKSIRKELLVDSRNKEAFECQNIDCSCNDCFFLVRKYSYCNKLLKDINIHSNNCNINNQKCFVHRKNVKI